MSNPSGFVTGLSEAHRRAVTSALLAMAAADGELDQRESALLARWLDEGIWGVSKDVIKEDVKHAQSAARALRGPNDYVALGRTCAQALPAAVARETLVSMMLAIAWADGDFRPEEGAIFGAFSHGLGLPRERVDALAGAAADQNIFAAIARGRLAAVRALLDRGTPVMSRDAKQWTPLHVAVATGQAAIVDLLLERGADVQALHGQGSPPLLLACNKPLPEIAERLLRAGAQVDAPGVEGMTALHVASMMGQLAVARVLRKAKASLELANTSGKTALHFAASEGKAELAAFLLAEGARVDARTSFGCTPLHHAATRGDLATVEVLLAARSDVHAKDADGQTPLHYAAAESHPESIARLLAAGASPSAVMNKGATPLHFAARDGSTTCVRLLLDAGAPVDARNVEGGTALFGAAIFDRRDVYELLVSRGANPDAATQFGTTPRGSIGVALKTVLRSVPLVAQAPGAPGPHPSALDAALAQTPLSRESVALAAAFDDYQAAVWATPDGTPDQVFVAGKDAKGRPEYVTMAAAAAGRNPRSLLMSVTDAKGRRWLPVFTSDAAADSFRRHTKVLWPEGGTGFAAAAVGATSPGIFEILDLPLDGVLLNPYGPGGPRALSLEECQRIARRFRGR